MDKEDGMIFLHTLDKVLSGEKTATSRLWKEDWFFPSDEYDRDVKSVVLSRKAWDAGKIRKLYYVGQILSAQPNRGQKGVAKIRILQLQKRDVRSYSEAEIAAEGYGSALEFYKVWYGMHLPPFLRLLTEEWVTPDKWLEMLSPQIAKHNTALFIRFELVQEGKS
jgi:hypothetical protein